MRTILLNLRNTIILLVIAYFAIPAVGSIIALTKGPPTDYRVDLPNYANEPWIKTYVREFQDLKNIHFSYYGWRRTPYTGETINVEPVRNIRVTPPAEGLAPNKVAYFFGGSTMWGSWVNDPNTIPAFFQKHAKIKAVNFGEGAWVSHQSLNQLIKLYIDGDRPDIVVFYDGVNDVHQQCRAEYTYFTNSVELTVRRALDVKVGDWAYYFAPIPFAGRQMAEALGLVDKHAKRRQYVCAENPERREKIATQLITDWQIAKQIVESRGGKFYAFLQPVAYMSKTKLDHLAGELDEVLGDEYKALYPLIRKKMTEAGIGTDISAALDRDEYLYVDFCHVSPNGNDIMAQAIAANIPTASLASQ